MLAIWHRRAVTLVHRSIICDESLVRFFFCLCRPKRKSLAKRKRPREFRRVRAATKGSAFGIRHLLKKVDENFQKTRPA